jgi:hypothetical protein
MKKITLLFALVFADIQTLWACPFCSDVLTRSKDAMQALRFGQGISWSLAVMLGVPFLIVAGFGIFIYRATRRRGPEINQT